MSDSLERAREHRASVRAAMGDVESALAAPGSGREGSWRRDLAPRLAALAEALDWHIATTEAADGLLADIVSAAPRLAHQVERARGDHARMRSDLQQAAAAVDAGADVHALRDQIVTVLTELVRHRQLGSD